MLQHPASKGTQEALMSKRYVDFPFKYNIIPQLKKKKKKKKVGFSYH